MSNLYEIQDDLAVLLDSLEGLDGTDDEALLAECLGDIARKTAEREAKVDGFIRWITDTENKVEGRRAEVKRLEALNKAAEARIDRAKKYVAAVMKATLPEPAKGARKLEGTLGSLGFRRGVGSIVVTDPTKVSADLMKATVTMSLKEWLTVQSAFSVPIQLWRNDKGIVSEPCIEESKTAIKAALEAGREVRGADVKYIDTVVIR